LPSVVIILDIISNENESYHDRDFLDLRLRKQYFVFCFSSGKKLLKMQNSLRSNSCIFAYGTKLSTLNPKNKKNIMIRKL